MGEPLVLKEGCAEINPNKVALIVAYLFWLKMAKNIVFKRESTERKEKAESGNPRRISKE